MAPSQPRRIIVALSGGMDSSSLLAKAWSLIAAPQSDLRAVSFNYGSKHAVAELAAAKRIADYYEVTHHVIDLREVFRGFRSALLADGPAVPEGHYQEENMRQTVVPGRNLILLSILAGLAESHNFGEVWIGAHQGDHFIYPDCRPEFINAAMACVNTGSTGMVTVAAPFLNDDKESILRWGLPNGVPYNMTRTCYTSDEIACGKCGSCQERLDAFSKIGQPDPLEYQTRELLPKAHGG